MGVTVKICGITSVDAADAAAKARADFGGLVFHRASPRYLNPVHAGVIAERLRGRLRMAALLVDPNDEEVAGVIAVVRPDFLQLHGRETPARVGAIRSRFGIPVIKVFSIAETSDFSGVASYNDAADMFLFDAKAPESASRPGGHGAAFDWQLLRGRSFARPWLLAGGLNADNVARAIAVSGAVGVDVSSGVETAPGVKSPELIRNFVETARNAQFAGGTDA
ncbi:MAG TPA: phosphoribosylanthranilate isomerase [Rhizomicrobium sp.]|nr:phosphoribosylanthranilate isomerase [Rhizomicrobium sp.]